MPVSKKPRKHYSKKHVIHPSARDHWRAEGGALAALMALESGQFSHDNLAQLITHATICQNVAIQLDNEVIKVHAESLLRTFRRLMATMADDEGTIAITSMDATSIQASMSVTLEWLRGRSNVMLARAARECMDALQQIRSKKQPT